MNESRTIYLSTAIVASLWAVSFIGIGVGWVLMLADHRGPAVMLGFTTVAVLAVAVVMTFRLYAIRICSVIRAINGLDHRPNLEPVPRLQQS